MRNSFGKYLKLTIFGASHAPQIGMTLEGIPAGLPVDMQALHDFLRRRAPGQHPWSTTRKETDLPQFLSGLADGVTDGAVIEAVIRNENARSADYQELAHIPRPGHADFTAWMKYGLDYDMAGGGPFSGRMTAPLCIAGGLCKQWLARSGVDISAKILQIGSIHASISEDFSAEWQAAVAAAHVRGDSLGGRIGCTVTGLPIGLGGALFEGVEGHLAQILFSIPAVKNVGFGESEAFAYLSGSEANDPFRVKDGKIITETNHCGGILGGITNGMPLEFDVTFKATPSISLPQKSVNLDTMEETTVQIHGRHDPCIVPRAVPVVEAAAAIAIFDFILGNL